MINLTVEQKPVVSYLQMICWLTFSLSNSLDQWLLKQMLQAMWHTCAYAATLACSLSPSLGFRRSKCSHFPASTGLRRNKYFISCTHCKAAQGLGANSFGKSSWSDQYAWHISNNTNKAVFPTPSSRFRTSHAPSSCCLGWPQRSCPWCPPQMPGGRTFQGTRRLLLARPCPRAVQAPQSSRGCGGTRRGPEQAGNCPCLCSEARCTLDYGNRKSGKFPQLFCARCACQPATYTALFVTLGCAVTQIALLLNCLPHWTMTLAEPYTFSCPSIMESRAHLPKRTCTAPRPIMMAEQLVSCSSSCARVTLTTSPLPT